MNTSTKEMQRIDWLKERQKGIGGSDVPAILGVSPYKTPYDVYCEKVADVPVEIPDTPQMKFGRDMEEFVAGSWSEMSGFKVQRDNKIRHHKTAPVLIANIDRMIHTGDHDTPGVLEIKTTNKFAFRQWEDDGLPLIYYTQIMHYLNVTGWDWGHVAVFLAEDKSIENFPVDNDPEMIKLIHNKLVEWWSMYVVTKTPPPPQNVDDVYKMFPISESGKLLEATTELQRKVEHLKGAKADLKIIGETILKLEQEIKVEMKDNEVLVADGKPLATWKTSKGRLCFDSKRFEKEHPDIYERFVYVAPGSRRFLIK